MSKKLKFTVVDGGRVIGQATLTDADELEYENDAVKAIMEPFRRRSGTVAAFDFYADWSNGYLLGKLIDPAVVASGADGKAAAAQVAEKATTVKRWRGLIGPFNVVSGDKREFRSPGEWEYRDLPRPASYQREEAMGHDGSVTVGRITSVELREEGFWGDGDWLESMPETSEAQSLLQAGVLYPSVDLDDYEYHFELPDGRNIDELTDEEFEEAYLAGVEPIMVFTKGRIGKVTFLAFEAFPQTTLEMYDGPPEDDRDDQKPPEDDRNDQKLAVRADGAPAVFAAIGDTSLPVASRETSWDGSGAASHMLSRAKGDGEEADPKKLAQGFFYRDDDGDPALAGSYKLPFCDVIDGTLKIVYGGVSAAAGRLDQTSMPDDQRENVRSKINAAYARCADAFDDPSIKPPWSDDSDAGMQSALVAAGARRAKTRVGGIAPLYPPESWFADPRLSELTPVTVVDSGPDRGRVFGHLSDRDCHLSYLSGGECVLPPDEGGMEWFHRGEVRTADGTTLSVGLVTAGGGHADLSLNAARAVAHYDDTSTQVAQVRAGRDEHGTWIAGSLVPEATEAQVQLLRRSPLSGDWRWIGGARMLVHALAVNMPGFAVVRGRVSHRRQVAVVASGWRGWKPSAPVAGRREPLLTLVERGVKAALADERRRERVAAEAERVAAGIGRGRTERLDQLAAEVHPGG